MDSQLQITIYTDGACDIHAANKPGGWAAILLATDADGNTQKERVISGGAETTTNNQMELRAVIEALKRLREPSEVRIVSDSRYVIDIASGKKKALTNADLWREYRELQLATASTGAMSRATAAIASTNAATPSPWRKEQAGAAGGGFNSAGASQRHSDLPVDALCRGEAAVSLGGGDNG